MSNVWKAFPAIVLLVLFFHDRGLAGETLEPLQGAWASQGLACDQVFRREGGQMKMKKS